MKLNEIVDYLSSVKYAKAKDHLEEVHDFLEILDQVSSDIFTVFHNRHNQLASFAPFSAQQPQQAQQLAIAYNGGSSSQFPANKANAAWANVASPSNWSTPEMSL